MVAILVSIGRLGGHDRGCWMERRSRSAGRKARLPPVAAGAMRRASEGDGHGVIHHREHAVIQPMSIHLRIVAAQHSCSECLDIQTAGSDRDKCAFPFDPFAAAPVPWFDEVAAMDPTPVRPGLVFLADIILGKLPIGQSPAIRHEPGVQVLPARGTNPDRPPVAVGARHQRFRGSCPAIPCQAPCAAGLARLRRIDAEQAIARSIDVHRVCIDNADLAGNRGFDHRRRDFPTTAAAASDATGPVAGGRSLHGRSMSMAISLAPAAQWLSASARALRRTPCSGKGDAVTWRSHGPRFCPGPCQGCRCRGLFRRRPGACLWWGRARC